MRSVAVEFRRAQAETPNPRKVLVGDTWFLPRRVQILRVRGVRGCVGEQEEAIWLAESILINYSAVKWSVSVAFNGFQSQQLSRHESNLSYFILVLFRVHSCAHRFRRWVGPSLVKSNWRFDYFHPDLFSMQKLGKRETFYEAFSLIFFLRNFRFKVMHFVVMHIIVIAYYSHAFHSYAWTYLNSKESSL